MEYKEFLNKLKKVGSKPHKLTHCRGSRDAWKWVRKNKWKAVGGKPFDELLYSKIVNEVNKALIEFLLDGHEIEFPHQMGSLRLSTLPTVVYYKDGELKTNYRNDWDKTLRLWYVDEEARNTHKPIKNVQKRIYFIRYYKAHANYHNKRFYSFRVNRALGKRVGKESGQRRMVAEPLI